MPEGQACRSIRMVSLDLRGCTSEMDPRDDCVTQLVHAIGRSKCLQYFSTIPVRAYRLKDAFVDDTTSPPKVKVKDRWLLRHGIYEDIRRRNIRGAIKDIDLYMREYCIFDSVDSKWKIDPAIFSEVGQMLANKSTPVLSEFLDLRPRRAEMGCGLLEAAFLGNSLYEYFGSRRGYERMGGMEHLRHVDLRGNDLNGKALEFLIDRLEEGCVETLDILQNDLTFDEVCLRFHTYRHRHHACLGCVEDFHGAFVSREVLIKKHQIDMSTCDAIPEC